MEDLDRLESGKNKCFGGRIGWTTPNEGVTTKPLRGGLALTFMVRNGRTTQKLRFPRQQTVGKRPAKQGPKMGDLKNINAILDAKNESKG